MIASCLLRHVAINLRHKIAEFILEVEFVSQTKNSCDEFPWYEFRMEYEFMAVLSWFYLMGLQEKPPWRINGKNPEQRDRVCYFQNGFEPAKNYFCKDFYA